MFNVAVNMIIDNNNKTFKGKNMAIKKPQV